MGYSQVFQGLQAREGFLGHRLDLVSKQSPAVPEHEGRRLMKRKGRGRKGEKREQDGERSTISPAESDKSEGIGGVLEI